MRHTLLLTIFLNAISLAALCQAKDSAIHRKAYNTARLRGEITLDGIPKEDAWNEVEWGGDFVQMSPDEGKPPSQPTSFKILYDDKFLYIAYRCHDVSPDSIVRRMGRRDDFPGDWIEVNIDSYHDYRTAFSFTLSASGVRNDEFASNDGNNWDANWNPIWYAKTHVDSSGWTAEVKIPFSQLRYGSEKEKVWGIQFMRRLFRKEERDIWQPIPRSSGVWMSRCGELHGLKDIPMHRQVEIAPYVIAQLDKYPKETGNPFATGTDTKLAAGVDGKVAVTNNLILDFTINPDFGQVEADPSEVRIDGFQTFFQEKRPFFIEGRNIFDYQLTGSQAGGEYDADLLFYSRRIGSSPHSYPNLYSNEFADVPMNTSILGAAKFSGKTKKGWSIGILESVTQREVATIDSLGVRKKEVVEPLTNYFVGRVQKDIQSGNTVLGGIFTAVNRSEGLEDMIARKAYSAGFDFLHYWRHRTWYIQGNVVVSNLQGSKQAILNTQTAFEHLFQRTDAPEVSVDSNRTSLSGSGITFKIGKQGGKEGKHGEVFRFETGVTTRSPGLELNDIGFMLTANEINHFYWMGWVWNKPSRITRQWRINYNHWFRWDYGGKFLYQAFNTNAHATFKNNWQTGGGVTWNTYDVSNNALRGTTALRHPAGIGNFYYLTTDYRKKVYFNLNENTFWGFDNTVKGLDLSLGVVYQPTNALQMSLTGGYDYYWRRQDQFVSNNVYNGENRSVVAEVNQNTLRFTARVSYNITPDLTVQYYGQPYITRPLYSHYAYVSSPMAKKYDQRFTVYDESQISESNGTFYIDENRDGYADYSFAKPDFNFVQFRSNLVLRWEYKPGSELYLVWSQSNTPPEANNDLDTPLFKSLFTNAFAQQGRNIFLIKCTYRFLR